jgi:ATP-dependent helicase/nuclease subunit B
MVPASMTAAFDVLFGGRAPRWFTIAAHRPFLGDLAFALDAAFEGRGPEALADAVVFTPTRRSGRELVQAFVRTAQGRAVLLPQIRAIGDLDEGEPPFEPGELALDLPPAVSPLRRRFELARLVSANAHLLGRAIDAPAAVELADALAGFLDAIQIEQVADPERIAGLVEGEMARHWERSARFLAIATEQWPKRLADLGLVDVAERRIALLRALAEQWRAHPPQRPIVVAGSTDAAPAMADLLAAASHAPHGCVVLPGLDSELPEPVWAKVGEGHPQFALKRILALAGLDREAVAPWPTPESQAELGRARDRRRLVNEALRPADTTDDWRRVLDRMRDDAKAAGVAHDPIARGLEGLGVCIARGEDEAAGACAALLREALETPGRTAALVTPDPALARRVSAALSRWGVEVDSSAGAPLAAWPAGMLSALVAATLDDPMAPAALLGIVKHDRVGLGLDAAALEARRRRLERRGLRGARAADWPALLRRLEPAAHRLEAGGEAAAQERTEAAAAIDLAARLRAALALAAAPFADGEASAAEAARGLTRALEALAADARGRLGELWAGADGEAAAALLAGLIADGDALPPCTASGFAALVRTLLAGQVVRSGGRTHPRLRILGLIEARLVGADLVVLAGLEEGVWPAGAGVDPFLSRPMRTRLGLPSPERRVGQAAHDFAQAACAREVVMVARERRDGQPAVKSRWLWRLETLARGAGLALPGRDDALAVARALDAPLLAPPPALATARPPTPRPPLAARPRELSVTDVEKLVRDPYAVYARRVLGLRALERPDERIEARARGTAIHSAFEGFARVWPELDPGRAPARFAELYVTALREQGAPEVLMAREAVLAARIGDWVSAMETRRRAELSDVRVEQGGALDLGAVTLVCRADRLEVARDGRVNVLDFKTGRTPSRPEIAADFAPQLTLTAALLMRGGFVDLGPRTPGDLVYLRVSGRDPAGEEKLCISAADSAAAAQSAIAGLQALLARYADPDEPYRSRIAPRFVRELFSDYDALARVAEWRAADGEDEG